MKFSLLYKNIPDNLYGEKTNPFDIIYDLSIDKAVSQIYFDLRREEYFLSVLKKPLTDVDEIKYRQEILSDFIEYGELFDELKIIFARYDKIKSDWVELRSGVSQKGSSANSEALLEYTFSSLKITSIFPRTIISFYESIYQAIKKYPVKSRGLSDMMTYCREMIGNNSLNEIADIAALFQYKTAEEYDFSVVCRLDSTLRLLFCELCDVKEHKKEKKSLIDLKKLGLIKSDKNNSEGEITCERDAIDNARYILTEALYHIDSVLTQITNSVYEVFFGLSGELMFYDVSLRICEYLTEAEVPMCFPEILPAEADTIKINGLRDFYLIAGGKRGTDVIPNDVSFTDEYVGVLIRGMNNTGKTTFLRSVGIAQIFAQAGIPICAESGTVSIRKAVFTHFSSAEEDFVQGDTSGRFEGEVKEMAKMVDNLEDYSLIILNETFQTTAYDEGANGIYNILRYFPKKKSKFIFVTHLLKLFDMCSEGDIRLMETVINKESDKSPYIITDIEK